MSLVLHRVIRKVFTTAVLLLAASASSVFAETSVKLGVDYWDVQTDVQTRYMPNYSTLNPWKNTASWIAVSSSNYLTEDLQYSLQGQYHEIDGAYITRAYLDWKPLESTGVRVGVIPYRMNNCQQYGDKSVWIREPDPFCRFRYLNEISQGSAGVQVYQTSHFENWVVDYALGVFNPMLDKQDDKLGPYKKVGQTLEHGKKVASASAIYLPTGAQLRVGVSKTDLMQRDDRPVAHPYTRDLQYSTWFMSADWFFSKSWSGAVSASGLQGDQLNMASRYSFKGRSLSVETSYRVTSSDWISVGYNSYQNITKYLGVVPEQVLRVPSQTVSWRHSFQNGAQVKVQYLSGSDFYLTTSGAVTFSKNRAVGAQVSYAF